MSVSRCRAAMYVLACATATGLPFAGAVRAGNIVNVHSFLPATSGSRPYSGLIPDAAGNLYGVTSTGGANNGGTLYRIAAGATTPTTLLSFSTSAGINPASHLLYDGGKYLYGTTSSGGASGQGTVFKYDLRSGSVATLGSFAATSHRPVSSLVPDDNGNLIGMTSFGGTSGLGTIFRISNSGGPITTLFNFDGTNGARPSDGLVRAANGDFYGTTSGDADLVGGSLPARFGNFFRLSADGSTLTNLVTIKSTDPSRYLSKPLIDSAGRLVASGRSSTPGVIRVTPGADEASTSYQTIATMPFNVGGIPESLIEDAAGNLFGVGSNGGASGVGSIYRVDAATNQVTVAAAFQSISTEPQFPNTGLYADAAGVLYGTTGNGGANLQGTIYKAINTGFVVRGTSSAWAKTTGGLWGTAANWTGIVPDAAGATATFSSAIATGATITIDGARTVGSIVFLHNTQSFTLTGGSLNLDVPGGSATITASAGNHAIASPVTVADPLAIGTGNNAAVYFTNMVTANNAEITTSGMGTVKFANLRARTLNIAGGTVQLTGPAMVQTLVLAGAAASPNSQLDLGQAAIIIDYSNSLGTLLDVQESRISAGRGTRNPGNGVYAYDGDGITSKTALTANAAAGFNQFAVGAINNADLNLFNGAGGAYTIFGGFNVDATSVLIRYTYAGDANLDGRIDSKDYSLINRGLAGTIPNVGWLSGDFNLDGVINAADYAIIDFGYLKQGSALTLGSPVAVPEPAGMGLMVGVAMMAMRRRRD